MFFSMSSPWNSSYCKKPFMDLSNNFLMWGMSSDLQYYTGGNPNPFNVQHKVMLLRSVIESD